MSHDPLCPARGLGDHWADLCGDCKLIARVREDQNQSERTRWYSVNEEAADRVARARATALRDAVEAVKALPRFDEYGYGLVVHPDGDFWDRKEVVAAIESLGGER